MNIKAKKNVTKQSDNNLIAICESKVTLNLNKPTLSWDIYFRSE